MKLKIYDKQTSKWWSGEKNITWAHKNGDDWWLIKPEEKIEPALGNGKTKTKQKFNPRYLCMAAFIGAMSGVCLLSIIYIYLLIRNAA